MKALSLFNGISGLHCALDRAGIDIDFTYYSEIDKFANKVTELHYPNDAPLGDVTKWQEWDIDWSDIGIVAAGFPCQAWSLAGKQLGDKDPRGALFWTTLDVISNVLKHNPEAKFIMENVKMKKEFEDYITKHTEDALGYVEKTLINSALVSAQNRNRFYWTNFVVTQPEDKVLVLRDIIEQECIEVYDNFASDVKNGLIRCDQNMTGESQTLKRSLKSTKCGDDKANTVTACFHKGMQTNSATNIIVKTGPCELLENPTKSGHVANALDINGHDILKRVYSSESKSPTLTAAGGGNNEPKVLCGDIRGRYIVDGKRQDSKMKTAGLTTQRLELRKDEKTNTLTTVQKDNVLCFVEQQPDTHNGILYRKLTPLECERLQTLPDNWTAPLSKTQRYKSIGNGWTIDVIVHILKCGFSEE